MADSSIWKAQKVDWITFWILLYNVLFYGVLILKSNYSNFYYFNLISPFEDLRIRLKDCGVSVRINSNTDKYTSNQWLSLNFLDILKKKQEEWSINVKYSKIIWQILLLSSSWHIYRFFFYSCMIQGFGKHYLSLICWLSLWFWILLVSFGYRIYFS